MPAYLDFFDAIPPGMREGSIMTLQDEDGAVLVVVVTSIVGNRVFIDRATIH